MAEPLSLSLLRVAAYEDEVHDRPFGGALAGDLARLARALHHAGRTDEAVAIRDAICRDTDERAAVEIEMIVRRYAAEVRGG